MVILSKDFTSMNVEIFLCFITFDSVGVLSRSYTWDTEVDIFNAVWKGLDNASFGGAEPQFFIKSV